MAIPQSNMRDLLSAGVHFGHNTRRWNPKMRQYIFGVRNDIHIIDLQQTVVMLDNALRAVREIVANGGRVLFVGTKRQAQEKIAESAKRCGQYYVNHRWLGGMLTNWKTVSKSINRLRELEDLLSKTDTGLTKKELLMNERTKNKLDLALGGIKDMGGQPDALFVIDINKEEIAVKEARKLGIPVFAVVDTNCDPDGIDYLIPGNDDAMRSISLYCDLFADAVIDGLQAELASTMADAGEAASLSVQLPDVQKEEEKSGKDAKKSSKDKDSEPAKEDAKAEKKEDKADKKSGKKSAKKETVASDAKAKEKEEKKAEEETTTADLEEVKKPKKRAAAK